MLDISIDLISNSGSASVYMIDMKTYNTAGPPETTLPVMHERSSATDPIDVRRKREAYSEPLEKYTGLGIDTSIDYRD